MTPSPPWRQELALVTVTMAWGASFLLVHQGVAAGQPFHLVALRFMAAGVFTTVLVGPRLRSVTLQDVAAGCAIGVSVFLGYGLQALGMTAISASQSAFISAFYVPLAPLLQWVITRRSPSATQWIAIALAFAGLLLLASPDLQGFRMGKGVVVTILAAVAIAAEVVLIGVFARGVDVARVTLIQVWVAGLLAEGAALLLGENIGRSPMPFVAIAVGLGLASALIQLTMNWAQRAISPTRATIIYAGEPIWAGLAGWLGGDRLPALGLAGAGMLITGMVISGLSRRIDKRASP